MIFKQFLFLVSFLLIAIFSNGQDIKEGEILIMLNNQTSVSDFCTQLNKDFPAFNATKGEQISRKINVWSINYEVVSFTPNQALEIIKARKEVVVSQFNHTNIMLRGDTCPDDTYFSSNQWSLKNTGQAGGVVRADIQACEAWGITTQDTTALGDEIVVAVIDNGFYLAHDDLDYFRNYNEIPRNGIDDDGNGYIDDTLGWNTYNDTNAITARSHGTMVSGIIGAKSNNELGVAGVNWGMKVLPIQGSSSIESTVLKSYGYVLEMRALYDSTNGAKGAYIVATNSSFGINNARASGYPLWCAFYDSLGKYGILNVTATANANTNVDTQGDMPTTCLSDYVIAVTNTNRNDTKVTAAGFGLLHIDLGAPGEAITSTTNGNGYHTSSGTSFSAPHVSGAVGFMYAVACANFMTQYRANPDSMALEVKNIILENGDSVFSLMGLTVTSKRLNLYKSAIEMRTAGACALTTIQTLDNNQGKITLYPNPNDGSFKLDFSDFEKGEYSYSIVDVTGKLVSFNTVNITSSSNTISIEMDNRIDKGVYFLCLKSSNYYSKTIKFVVNN